MKNFKEIRETVSLDEAKTIKIVADTNSRKYKEGEVIKTFPETDKGLTQAMTFQKTVKDKLGIDTKMIRESSDLDEARSPRPPKMKGNDGPYTRRQIEKAAKEAKVDIGAKSRMMMALRKMNESVELDEVSAKLARKAAAASAAKSFEYGSSAYGPGSDKETDRLDKKADKARAHVQKRQGDKGVKKVDRMTGKLIYGRNEEVELDEGRGEALKAFEALVKRGGIDRATFQKAYDLYKATKFNELKKLIRDADTDVSEAIADLIQRHDSKAFNSMYPKAKSGDYLRNITRESAELDELSIDTMKSYRQKAADDVAKNKKPEQRTKGAVKATGKIYKKELGNLHRKEETDVEEMSTLTKIKAKIARGVRGPSKKATPAMFRQTGKSARKVQKGAEKSKQYEIGRKARES